MCAVNQWLLPWLPWTLVLAGVPAALAVFWLSGMIERMYVDDGVRAASLTIGLKVAIVIAASTLTALFLCSALLAVSEMMCKNTLMVSRITRRCLGGGGGAMVIAIIWGWGPSSGLWIRLKRD